MLGYIITLCSVFLDESPGGSDDTTVALHNRTTQRLELVRNAAVSSARLFHPWRIDGGWVQSLNAKVSFLDAAAGPGLVEPTNGTESSCFSFR